MAVKSCTRASKATEDLRGSSVLRGYDFAQESTTWRLDQRFEFEFDFELRLRGAD